MGGRASRSFRKHGGLNMSVQELIDALNKVDDKSKSVIYCTLDDIETVEEGTTLVEIY